ncbi:MAG: protein kinase [Myxococcales bacterium]|nr:protein kinase [Myxococcales bacterium]
MTADDEATHDRSGDTVGGRYRLGALLGSGGMADVFAATDEAGNRVALKLLHSEMSRRRDLKERFLREAYVANRIGHPGIVKILGHGDGKDVFLVIELLEGEPLSARIKQAGAVTVRELMQITDQILDALSAAHAASVVHRDIKPDNIFITRDGVAKILDFGIARVLDDVPSEVKTRTGLALGTIPYMAPEQALGRREQLDGRTDLFALGALLFRALAGRRIHEEPSEAELLVAMATKPAPKLLDLAPAVPAPVAAIIDRALAFKRDDRYPDAATMQRDVRALLAGNEPPHAMALLAGSVVQAGVGSAFLGPAPSPSARAAQDAATVVTAAAKASVPLSGGPQDLGPPSFGAPPAEPSPGPQSFGDRTLESVGVDQARPAGPSAAAASFTAQANFEAAGPMSASPTSLSYPTGGVTPTAPVVSGTRAKRSGTVVGLLALGGGGVVLLGVTLTALLFWQPWETESAAGGPGDGTSIAIASAVPNAPGAPAVTALPGSTGAADPAAESEAKPEGASTLAGPTAPQPPQPSTAEQPGTAQPAAAATVKALTSPGATSRTTPGATAPPAPSPTGAPSPAAATPASPPPTGAPSPAAPPATAAPTATQAAPGASSGSDKDKDKGKGKDKDKGQKKAK